MFLLPVDQYVVLFKYELVNIQCSVTVTPWISNVDGGNRSHVRLPHIIYIYTNHHTYNSSSPWWVVVYVCIHTSQNRTDQYAEEHYRTEHIPRGIKRSYGMNFETRLEITVTSSTAPVPEYISYNTTSLVDGVSENTHRL